MLTKFVPPTLTEIDVDPSFIKIFSADSATNFPISLIDFLGTMPDILFGTASFRDEFATASLLPSVATAVIILSSTIRFNPDR